MVDISETGGRHAPKYAFESYKVTSRSYQWSDADGEWYPVAPRYSRSFDADPTVSSLKTDDHRDEHDLGHIVRATDPPERWDLGYTRVGSLNVDKRLTLPFSPPEYDTKIVTV